MNVALTRAVARARTALRAGSVEPGRVHDRRQRRRERGRPALPQVRRDDEPRPRAHGAPPERRDRASSATRRARHDGYDLVGAFVGSEGCFGIALDVTVRLIAKSRGACARCSPTSCRSTRRRARSSAIVATGIVPGGARDDRSGDDPRGRGVDLRRRLSDRRGRGAAHRGRRRARGPRARRRDGRSASARRTARAPCASRATKPSARGSGRDARRRSARWAASRRTSSCRTPSCRARSCPRCSRDRRHRRATSRAASATSFTPATATCTRTSPYDAADADETARVHVAMREIMRGVRRRRRHDHRRARRRPRQAAVHGSDLLAGLARDDVRAARRVRSGAALESGQGRSGALVPRMARGAAAARDGRDDDRGRRRRPVDRLRDRVRDAAERGAPLRIVGARHVARRRPPGRVDRDALDAPSTPGSSSTCRAISRSPRAPARRSPRFATRRAPHGQWLALDPYGCDDGTLGATIATASPGRSRTSFGTPRDLVLGVEFVTGAGVIVRGGGRVVKNVAGFDLTRLLTGSWGTLGVITEVTVRLHARPEADDHARRSRSSGESTCRSASAAAAAPLPFAPYACEVVNDALARVSSASSGRDGALSSRRQRRGGRRAARARSPSSATRREVDRRVWSALRAAEPHASIVVAAVARCRREIERDVDRCDRDRRAVPGALRARVAGARHRAMRRCRGRRDPARRLPRRSAASRDRRASASDCPRRCGQRARRRRPADPLSAAHQATRSIHGTC